MSVPEDLRRLGERPLLILCDYDGTLAPIVTRPEDAHPEGGAHEALLALTQHHRHRVVIITGRGMDVVHGFLNLPNLMVIGLHGMAWPDEPTPAAERDAIERIRQQLPDVPGLRLEDKTFTLAVHYRDVPGDVQGDVERQLESLSLPAGWEIVTGKKVREYRPSGFGKGRAACRIAERYPQLTPVFLGDDVTDEEAFLAVHQLGGVTVKVGEGESHAQHRVAFPSDVVELLRTWAQAQ